MRLLSRTERCVALDGRGRRRVLLAVGASAALVALTVVMAVKEVETPRSEDRRPAISQPVDPLAAEFARCQALGEAGAHDPQCLAAWAENRRRFLMPDHRVVGPSPAAPPTGVR